MRMAPWSTVMRYPSESSPHCEEERGMTRSCPPKQRGPGYCASDRFAPQKLSGSPASQVPGESLVNRDDPILNCGVAWNALSIASATAYYDQLASSGHRERARERLGPLAGQVENVAHAVHWECSRNKLECEPPRVGNDGSTGAASHCRLAPPRQWAAVNKLLDLSFPKVRSFSLQVARRHRGLSTTRRS